MSSDEESNHTAALEARIRRLEDQLAVYQLICSWGPAADTADGKAAAALWTDDAVLTAEGRPIDGAAGVEAMICSDAQQELVRRGCAHVQSLPVVKIDGDRATATNYGRVYVHADDGYEAWRVSVNRWELRRTPAGWRAAARTVHVIDGDQQARDLLAQGVADSPVSS